MKATERKNAKIVRAVKIIPKSKVKDRARFDSEIDVMKTLDHPNIIKLYETFEDSKCIYLVMDMCTGGELFDKITECGHFSEQIACRLFQQMIRAVNYCHQCSICHRDLKPENFLLMETTHKDNMKEAVIKIIDFGLSKHFDSKSATEKKMGGMTTKAGTPQQISPEILKGTQDQKCDIWSAGVILQILLCGQPPFWGDSDEEILGRVKKGRFEFDGEEWNDISEEAKDLIKKMLAQNPAVRITAEEALNHAWIKNVEMHSDAPIILNIESLKRFTKQNKLKKAVLTCLAQRCSDKEIEDLRKLFESIDTDGSGTISVDEMKKAQQDLGMEAKVNEVDQLMKEIDTDGSGVIDYTEFIASMLNEEYYTSEERLREVFNTFDIDRSGSISKDEIYEILGKEGNIDMDQIQELIDEVDINGDGEIDFEEFCGMMKRF